MKKAAKKSPQVKAMNEFRPYRVLFLIVVVSVTCLVLFATLSVSAEL